MKLRILTWLLFCTGLSQAIAQNARIRVLDAETGQALAGVNAAWAGSSGALADSEGIIRLRLDGPTTVSLSFVGYHPEKISLSPGADETVRLRASAAGLDEVVVTGQFTPTEKSRSLYNVKVFNAGHIAARGAVNLTDILSMELNARVVNDNVLGSNIILQGLTGQNVKILMDGVPLISGEANEFDLNQLNMNQVERIEVIEGPLSVQYGTNALAGTVNIISRQLPDGKRLQGGVNAYYETVGKYNVDANIGTNLRDGSKLSLSGGRNRFTGFSPDDQPRNKLWNPSTQYFGSFKWVKRTGNLNYGLLHNQFRETQVSKGNPDPGFQYLTATDNAFTTNRFNSNIFLNGKPGNSSRSYIDMIAGYQYYDRISENYLVNVSDETRKRTSRRSTEFSSWLFRGAYSYTGSGLGFQVGYDVNLNNSAGDTVDSLGTSVNDIGIFGSLNIKPFRKLEIQPGFRYTYNSRYNTREINFLNTGLPVIPSLNLKYEVSRALNLRASYAKGFRAPSLRELFWDFQDANHSINGNPALQPEIADNYILSGKYTFGTESHRLGIQLMTYVNRIERKIELVDKDRSLMDPSRQNVNVAKTYANIPEFMTRGFNLNLSYAQGSRLMIRPGFGLLERSGSKSLSTRFYSFEANGNVSYALTASKIKLNLFYKYNGPMAQFSLSADNQLLDRTLGAYTLVDLSASRPFWGDKLFVTLGARNLLDVTNVVQTGEGSEGLVVRSGFKPSLPIAQGRQFFTKIYYSF